MKKNLLFASFLVYGFFMSQLEAQTAGTLSFTFTQPTPTSPSGTKNVEAVWIENSAGNFVKTRVRYVGNGTSDHLPTWTSKSGKNTVDATTGATLTSSTNPTAFGTKTIVWDGKDVNGTLVADGTYTVWIESSWQTSLASNTHNTIVNFSFTKGATAEHLTPADAGYFKTVSVDWTPGTTAVSEINNNATIVIYPNPTQRYFTVDLSGIQGEYKLMIYSVSGQKVYESSEKVATSSKTIDMASYESGLYIVKIFSGNQSRSYKVFYSK
jgi:hypothetical protein